MFDAVVITCEHGGNRVPRRYKPLFQGHEALLNSHRGYDPGALELARRFAKSGGWPLHYSTTTRLLCDLNRSFRRPGNFSEITAPLDCEIKTEILDENYAPYRHAVEVEIRRCIGDGHRVLHLSVHTFTPVLKGEVRNADVGLLYDPQRAGERGFCDAWHTALHATRPDVAIRRNYPYLGTADGFTTHLRFQYGPAIYTGIELEVNQRWPLEGGKLWKELQKSLVTSLHAALVLVQPAKSAREAREKTRKKSRKKAD